MLGTRTVKGSNSNFFVIESDVNKNGFENSIVKNR